MHEIWIAWSPPTPNVVKVNINGSNGIVVKFILFCLYYLLSIKQIYKTKSCFMTQTFVLY